MKPQIPIKTVQLTLEESLKLTQRTQISEINKKKYVREYLKNRKKETVSLAQIKREYPECFRSKKR